MLNYEYTSFCSVQNLIKPELKSSFVAKMWLMKEAALVILKEAIKGVKA